MLNAMSPKFLRKQKKKGDFPFNRKLIVTFLLRVDFIRGNKGQLDSFTVVFSHNSLGDHPFIFIIVC